jgi:hypothetical protein
LCSVHLRTSTGSWLWCGTPPFLACPLSDCCGRHSHLGSSRVLCVSFNASQCHWETRTRLLGYTAGLIVARGAISLGLLVVVLPRGISHTSVPSRERVCTFIGWFRVCGVAVLSGSRIIIALRAASLCGVGEVNPPRVPLLTPSLEIGNHSLLAADLGCGESETRAQVIHLQSHRTWSS